MDWSYIRDAAIALVPTTGVCILFYLGMKAIMNADRNERLAEREIDQAKAQKNKNPGAATEVESKSAD